MRKITLFLSLLITCSLSAQNSSGDTTFVNTDQVNLDYFGDFDSDVSFPDGSDSYRKIYMTCEVGQYDCDPGADYCHQWDYTVRLELITDNETYELGRFITPFATSGWPPFGSSWKQPYVFDVTDFYPLLQGDNTVRIHYEGYSGGFTAELKFAFVEGTPERDVLGVSKAYDVSATYGDDNDPFNDKLNTFSGSAPAGTESAEMKVIVAGHGNDDNGCCEFDSHSYSVSKDNAEIAQEDIWKDDCGENDLYPQGGTWLYDRSNWCPGSIVAPIYHSIPNISGSDDFDVDVEFEDYTGSGELGRYNFNATVFYYGEANKNTDAAVTDIIAPTTAPQHARQNPAGSEPVIEVRNTGNTAINSIDLSYGVQDSTQLSYTWNGNLPALENKTISLPAVEALTNLSLSETEERQNFEISITGVNGEADDDSSNDNLTSSFNPAPRFPSLFTVKMKTTNIGANGNINSSPADVSWEITDMEGNVVASRTDADPSTVYDDEIDLPETGFYKLKLSSENCYGLHWWVLDNNPSYSSGYLEVKDNEGELIDMNGYSYNGTPHDDWGCSFTQYFTVDIDDNAAVDEVAKAAFKLYPNPASEVVHVDFDENFTPPYQMRINDLQGRTVFETTTEKRHNTISVDQFSKGVYFLNLETKGNSTQSRKIIVE